ncbi:MAG: exo-alpha-sialidase [Planctomycetaceae bacterium]|nr:exo-alpha-sialidase [Planctomycetaceae bacterium]
MMNVNRRNALKTLASVGASAAIAASARFSSATSPSASAAVPPNWELRDLQTISLPGDRYYGWPTLGLRKSGELVVVASGGRRHHVCPFGRVDLLQSFDQGDSWTFARTICDGPIDDRDAGIIETPKGTLLATTFTSLAYVPTLQKALATAGSEKPSMTADELAEWKAAHGRLPEGSHEKQLGTWMLRSEDDGITWSPPYRVPVNSPHGPVVQSDGRLLYAGKALWTDQDRVGVCQSADDGKTWQWLADIPTRDGDDHRQYHELHAVECSSGRLIVQIRNHNSPNAGETLQSHSDDHGATWSVPRSIGVWGLPSHLLRLADGRLLMSYGHRRAPLGIQVRLSDDHGDHWSEPIVLYGDGASGDLGYPSTVQQADGSLCTVWYEVLRGNPRSQLRAARWKLL